MIWGGISLIVLVLFFLTFLIVEQQTVQIIERFGKFHTIKYPGLRVRIPFVDSSSGPLTLRLLELNIPVETKTKDNVFVSIKISVQYNVNPEKVIDAFYKLSNVKEQISSYIFDVVRATVPKMELDELFENKEDIANDVKKDLQETMEQYGYIIQRTLVTDIDPDSQVKTAMNRINAAQREKIAATEEGEALKIKAIKEAEALSESKRLQGEGVAKQRLAIIKGLEDSVSQFKESIPDSSSKDVMTLVLMTQYFDTLEAIGKESKTNAIFMPHSPGNLNEIGQQITNAIMGAEYGK